MVYYEIFLYLAKVVQHLRDAILVFPCLVDVFASEEGDQPQSNRYISI